jgi:hypothetical protein
LTTRWRSPRKVYRSADWNGPIENGRHCTDIFCLFLLVLSWVAMSGWRLCYSMAIIALTFILSDYQGKCLWDGFRDRHDGLTPICGNVNSYTSGVNACPSWREKSVTTWPDVRTLVTHSCLADPGWGERNWNWQPAATTTASGRLWQCQWTQVCTVDTCYPNTFYDSGRPSAQAKGFGFAYCRRSVMNPWRCYMTWGGRKKRFKPIIREETQPSLPVLVDMSRPPLDQLIWSG